MYTRRYPDTAVVCTHERLNLVPKLGEGPEPLINVRVYIREQETPDGRSNPPPDVHLVS